MLNLPNLLSLARIPLVLVFLQQNMTLRVIGIVLAMISDGLDGFIARRYNRTTQFGAFLDPLMDKFFVIFVLAVMLSEGRLSIPEMLAMLCRDFAVFFFGIYLLYKGSWDQYKFRSIWSGKVTTALQLSVLIALTMQISLPPFFFVSFIVLGFLALVELYLTHPAGKIAPEGE
jgi:CDP-diacylglycerol---glycerol-3-phosphate 3-phosphatidyltransferase